MSIEQGNENGVSSAVENIKAFINPLTPVFILFFHRNTVIISGTIQYGPASKS